MLLADVSIFWLSVAVAVYTYVGYPVFIAILARIRGRRSRETTAAFLPFVTLIIPAHNEERWIRHKIENTLELDYPRDLLQIVIASDGSSDRTVDIAREFESRNVAVAVFEERHGKQEMLNLLVPKSLGDIVVMTDTNVLLRPDSVRLLVRSFADREVGCVTGRRLCIEQKGVPQGAGENLYWRYESWIKRNESCLHSCLGAHGQLFAVRRSVFPPVKKVGEDFYIPMKLVASTGLRVIYEPEAIAYTPAAANLAIEFERKTRAHVSFLLTLPLLPELMFPFKTPVWWQYVSHHVLRMIVPPALIAMFVSSATLAPSGRVYFALFVAQVIFYALAAIGFALARRDIRVKLFYFPFYFTFANAALALALLRWPRRKYDYAWKRTERIPISN
jgi:cellulose synthase/poly-beta-1,6-N-acetylglucosamine synthase-like glycosyltransferase